MQYHSIEEMDQAVEIMAAIVRERFNLHHITCNKCLIRSLPYPLSRELTHWMSGEDNEQIMLDIEKARDAIVDHRLEAHDIPRDFIEGWMTEQRIADIDADHALVHIPEEALHVPVIWGSRDGEEGRYAFVIDGHHRLYKQFVRYAVSNLTGQPEPEPIRGYMLSPEHTMEACVDPDYVEAQASEYWKTILQGQDE